MSKAIQSSMVKHFKFLLLVVILGLSACAVVGCADVYVKKINYANVDPIPENAHPAPIKFSKLRVLLPPGTEVGIESGMFGPWCWYGKYPVSRRVVSGYAVKDIKQTFYEAMEANGYDVVENIDIDFRPEDEEKRAEYFISARVKDVDMSTCHALLNTASKGRFYMEIHWSVYDALRRTVVYQAITEGYSHRKTRNLEGRTLLFFDALEMATHNLAADEDFRALILNGTKPPPHWRKNKSNKDKFDDKPRMFDALSPLILEDKPLSIQPFQKHADQSRQATVTLQKIGHGSGFFISKQGHIITNQHVVGDARRMRVITSDKKHKMIAEVLRVDKIRDVALLKIEEMPKDLNITTLPIRFEPTKISEDVYAIGSPYDAKVLYDTISKGIISAHRTNKIEGIHLPFIQSDVDIHGGNSGGPLLDEKGNIIGISVSGYGVDGNKASIGLNFFIPIQEALAALDISIDGKTTPRDTSRPMNRLPPAEEAEEFFDDPTSILSGNKNDSKIK